MTESCSVPPRHSPPPYSSTSMSIEAMVPASSSLGTETCMLPASSSSGILVDPLSASPQHHRPRAKKRVSIDIHIPLDEMSPPLPRRFSVSHSSDRGGWKVSPHTKDIHGRFKNRRRSRSSSRPRSENLEIFESDEEIEEDDFRTKERITTEMIERRMIGKRRMSHVIVASGKRPSSVYPGLITKEELTHLRRHRDRSRESRSSTSSIHSGFSLLRGQSTRMIKKQSPSRRSLSSSSKSRSSQPIYIPAELLPKEAWTRTNVPVDLLDYNQKYGNPHTLILPAFFCILVGMGSLVVAFGTSGQRSKKIAVFGCGILSTGGILMVMSLCWYYVKSKCLYGDDDLEKIRKMSSQMLGGSKRIMSLATSSSKGHSISL